MIRLIYLTLLLASISLAAQIPVKGTRASATLQPQSGINYSTRNLVDGSANSVWAAPFQIKSLFVEFKVEAYEINALHILNGYRKDQQSYMNNSRAKTIKIFANNKNNLVKTVTLKDIPWEYCFGDYEENACRNFLNTTKYQPSEGENIKDACNSICSPLDYSEEIHFSPALHDVKVLIIQIESIYPGRKWNDLVISEVSFEGYAQNPLREGYTPDLQTMVDSRDGREYRTLKLGKRNWMAENLSYADEGSSCFEAKGGARCSEKGRVYQEFSVDDGLCPLGWRLPTREEFLEFNNLIKNRSSDTTQPYGALFVSQKSSNNFGLNFYNLDGLCNCFDAGCDGDPFEEDSYDLYKKFHSGDAQGPGETAFWIRKAENSKETDAPYMRFSSTNGAYVPSSEMMGCLRNGGAEHRKEFFVRCIEE